MDSIGLSFSEGNTLFKEHRFIVISLIIVELLLLALGAYYLRPLVIILAIAGASAILWSLFSVERALYIVILYIALFPSYSSYLWYPYLGVYVSLPLTIAVILVAFLFWLGRKALIGETQQLRFSLLDKVIMAFLGWMFFSMLWGLLRQSSYSYIDKEVFFLSLYGCYFLMSRNVTQKKQLKKLWFVVILTTFLVSFEYIFIAIKEAGFGGLLIKRVSTQQPHLAQLAVPLLISFFLFRAKRVHRILSLIALFPIFLMVFLSQQRSLWIGIVISLIVLWGFSFLKERISMKRLLKFVLFFVLVAAFVISSGLIIDKVFMGSTMITFIVRLNSLFNLSQDISMYVRIGEIRYALEQWRENIFLGTGLGSTIEPIILEHMPNDNVDNSYIVILWKMGIIGLILFLGMFFLFIGRGIYVFHKSTDVHIQRITAGLVAGLIGLMVIGLTNACLAFYRFNIIWAIAIGSIEVFFQNQKRQEKNVCLHKTIL